MKSVKEKNAILSISDNILQTIFQTEQYDNMQIDDQEETGKYYSELCDKLKATLNDEQKELFEIICDVSSSLEAGETEKAVLYGMQVYESFRTIVENPIEALNYYISKGEPIRELYKV